MRSIAEIIKDDKNGKRLSQTEIQIAIAYFQGKYDAIMELKIYNNSNANEILEKIRAEIQENINYNKKMNYQGIVAGLLLALDIIDKYKKESEGDKK